MGVGWRTWAGVMLVMVGLAAFARRARVETRMVFVTSMVA